MTIARTEGIAGLTIVRLAEEVDASVGGLYRYFPGKSALLVALQQRAVAVVGELAEEALAAEPNAGPLRRVALVFGAWNVLRVREPALFALIDQSLSDPLQALDDDEAAAVNEAMAPVLGRCARVLDEAVQAGVLAPGDGRVRTHVLWGALHGLSHFRKRDARLPPELATDALETELMRALLAGWAA